MGIVGDHPEGGTRFDLERRTTSSPWVYVGSAFTPEAEHAVHASIDAAGVVVVEDEASLPKELVQRAKLLLKAALKHALAGAEDGAVSPPRRLHRWRAA